MTFIITAVKRPDTAIKTRAQGLVPAVVYGPEITPLSVAVNYSALEKLYAEAGASSLVELVCAGREPAKILIQEVQRDPVKGRIIHADFRQINLNKEIHATIKVRLVGESLAVKDLGGTMVEGINNLSVKCLPKDLVSHVDVDISALKTFDDVIHISELQLPPRIVVTNHPATLVAKVMAPLTAEQLKAMEETAAVDVSAIEVEEKVKKEEVEGEDEEAEAKGKGEGKAEERQA